MLGRRRPGLAGGEAGPSLPRGTEAGAGHAPRRVKAVHERLLTMHHGEQRRARAHAAAVAQKQIAVAALMTLARFKYCNPVTIFQTHLNNRSTPSRIPSCRGSANSVPSTPVATTSARDHVTLVLGACGHLYQFTVKNVQTQPHKIK